MKNKIKLINSESVLGRRHESFIIDEINKRKFFKWMTHRGLDYDELMFIFESKKIDDEMRLKFNMALLDGREELGIEICDMIVFMEQVFSKFKRILNALDGEIYYQVKVEMAERFKIHLDKSSWDEMDE